MGKEKQQGDINGTTNFNQKQKGHQMKEVKQKLNKDGYLTVTLWKHCIPHKRLVHELVAEAFVKNPKNLPYVIHKNGVKTDNRAENLKWSATPEK